MLYDTQSDAFHSFMIDVSRYVNRARSKQPMRMGPTREYMTLNYHMYG